MIQSAIFISPMWSHHLVLKNVEKSPGRIDTTMATLTDEQIEQLILEVQKYTCSFQERRL